MQNITNDAIAIAAASLVRAAMGASVGASPRTGADAVIGPSRAAQVEKLYEHYVAFVRRQAED